MENNIQLTQNHSQPENREDPLDLFYKFEYYNRKLKLKDDLNIDEETQKSYRKELKNVILEGIDKEQINYFCNKCQKFHRRGKIYSVHKDFIDFEKLFDEDLVEEQIQFKQKFMPKVRHFADPQKVLYYLKLTEDELDENDWYFTCPRCHSIINSSTYLSQVFEDDPFAYWVACTITHYRHEDINYYDRTWKYARYGRYNPYYNYSSHEDFKEQVNERIKRNLIRYIFENPYFPVDIQYIFISKIRKLMNYDYNTLDMVDEYAGRLINKMEKAEFNKIENEYFDD